ncbi:MBL fold metallo-hydrolase [Liquorilactobacillus satsumensis]|uniref:MBL fold metallo-hydrolase n=1 Tax=Liquorilactobacillus satsumensis TaxID=259059 RepID=UPI0021C3BB00|nr:MBL fold metallo-hydrolase [Liquorilactobacillus satsumensis]MCP9313468.1 MBL fold metallo-hydrolase [Liquorilactobacillus satsumensis]MCP9360607.1 MBL fold metallo-hydrolase [Liquorilactobacillus satsumensis]
MKITVLGMYGGYPYDNQGTSSYLLQEDGFNLLLDCGSGALLSLEHHLDPMKLDAVLLSHYHYDHIADVGVLQYYWQLNNDEGKKILPIYGHQEDQEHFTALTWPHATKGYGYEPQKPLEIGPFQIQFLRTKHPVTAFAMRITTRERKTFVFTADTAYFSELVPFAHAADLLLTDTNFDAAKTGTKWHMTSLESGNLAKAAGVKQLVLSHLPQKIEFSKLQQEAQQAAGRQVIVEVAGVDKSFRV